VQRQHLIYGPKNGVAYGENVMAEGSVTIPFPAPFPVRTPVKELLADVLNATGIGTLVLDGDLNIRWFTSAFQGLFRLRIGDIGRPLAELAPLSADPDLLDAALAVLTGALLSEREVATNAGRWFSRRIQPCLTEDGQIEGVVISFVDITEQRKNYAALEAAEHCAQQATAAKSRFLAVASHDLRQPLQTMVILQGLLAGSVTGAKAKDLVGRMAETLGGMSRMLDVLLDIKQIEAGVVKPNLRDFPIMVVLQDLFDEFSTAATSRGVELRIVRSSLIVRSDPVLLEQMLRNLVSNALKYAPGGRVLIGCQRRGDEVVIRVDDTGIGIPAGEIAAIFDEYYQINADAPGLGQGMGLGLNIVQRLGAILGHGVSAKSALGMGASFAIRLPLGLEVAAVEAPIPVPKWGVDRVLALQKAHILVVEDDIEVGSLLHLLLTGEGHEVTLVETAQAAVARVASGLVPDLLVSDYNLPGGMDGLALTRALRVSGPLPAIVLSGDISAQAIRRIAGEDVLHLAKPVTVGRLDAAIASLLAVAEADELALLPERPQADPSAVVHIVDDDDGLRAALRLMLEEDGHVVRDHASCEGFLAGFDAEMTGCLLLDAYLPGMDGLALLDLLRGLGSRIPVIMITGQSDVAVAVAAMKAGAADFLEKPVSVADIRASIARVTAQDKPSGAVPIPDLTPRQTSVLEGVMAGKASKVIAFDLSISQRTVESHRAAIMSRMGAHSVPELVRRVLGVR
jgi:two-component system CheB/CheR fusion protein